MLDRVSNRVLTYSGHGVEIVLHDLDVETYCACPFCRAEGAIYHTMAGEGRRHWRCPYCELTWDGPVFDGKEA
jgi:transposase-like protein